MSNKDVKEIRDSSNSQHKLLYDDIVQVNGEVEFFAMDLSSAYGIAEHITLAYQQQFS